MLAVLTRRIHCSSFVFVFRFRIEVRTPIDHCHYEFSDDTQEGNAGRVL